MSTSENKYQTIVVGGGIAGLTSAVYLARAGQKVLLIEKNEVCGGLVNSFKREGFHFDAGVRALEDAGIIFPMLKDLGIQLEVVKSPVSIGIENEILNIKDISSLKEYRDLLVKLYPGSEEAIDETIKIIKKVMKQMDVLYGVENPVFKDLKRDREFIFKKLLPWMPKFIFTVGKINRMNMPVEGYLENIIKDPSLRDIISQHFFKDTPTFFALSYFTLYLDYFYPKGGVGKLADVLKNKIKEFGGEIKMKTTVIETDAVKQTLKDDKDIVYEYDQLIWAGDLKTFYNHTITEGFSEKLRSKFNSVKDKMNACRGGDSVFSIFFQVDESLESFREIANGHFFYTPSKKGLGQVHRKDLQQLISQGEKIEKDKVFQWLHKFTKLNTYEISIPGLKDPTLVPKGKTALIISFLAEYDLFKLIRETDWYEEFLSELENQVIKVISDSVYPFLKDKIIKHFSFSPLSIENRIGSSEGAIVGWSFEKPVPVLNKIQIANKSVLTPISTIFQAGQWAYSPAGVPMSILTGKIAADKVLKKAKKISRDM